MQRLFFGSPLLSLLYFYIFSAIASFYLGYLPQYGKPDPKHFINELLMLSVYIFWLLAIASLFYSLLRSIKSPDKFKIAPLVQGIVFFSVFYFDPLGLIEWFMD